MNKQSNSPYNQEAKISKLNYTQLTGILPFIPKFEYLLNPLVSYNRQDVMIEFPHYVEFILEHVVGKEEGLNNKESKKQDLIDVIVGYDGIGVDAKLVKLFLDRMNSYMRQLSEYKYYGGKRLNRDRCSQLLMRDKSEIIIGHLNKCGESLIRLWDSFILNIVMLNIKSLILCAENSSPEINKIPLVPIKFYPKIGNELSLLFKEERDLTIEGVKEKLITGELEIGNSDIEFFVNSLSKESVSTFLDNDLSGKTIPYLDIADSIGLGVERYSKAEEIIITSSSYGVNPHLDECQEYLDEISDYIMTLTALQSELRYLNKNRVYIILDFKVS